MNGFIRWCWVLTGNLTFDLVELNYILKYVNFVKLKKVAVKSKLTFILVGQCVVFDINIFLKTAKIFRFKKQTLSQTSENLTFLLKK